VPTDEPWWLEPYPDTLIDDLDGDPEARYDAQESIALSFVAALQHLPTQQRAALVLRDVLGFSAAEVAEMLDATPASVNSALQRARAALHPIGRPDRIPLPRSQQESHVVDRFVDAFQRGDIDGVVALLTQDAKITMPPEPFEFHGPRDIAAFYHSQGIWRPGLKLVATRANRQPAIAYYLPNPDESVHLAGGILVLAVTDGNQISAITRFSGDGLFAHFGLPHTLPSS
jgi:RNA polymerase sigma-70 factor (ECF subfamily)